MLSRCGIRTAFFFAFAAFLIAEAETGGATDSFSKEPDSTVRPGAWPKERIWQQGW